MKNLLVEIGLEEVPARFIRATVSQLKEKFHQWLDEHRLEIQDIKGYATPRRIAIVIQGLPEKQPDLHEEVRGPSRKIAQTETGEWSKAAQGFARSQQVDVEDLFFKEVKGTEYIFVNKSSTGVDTRDLLQDQLPTFITSLSFPVNMRWGAQSLKFIRPIRWLVALYGEEVIPFEIAGVKSGNRSKGHRFLGEEVEIASADQYVSALEEQFVYVDIEQRKQMITEQIESMAKQNNWHIAVNEELLEEVVFLVEYPTALSGSFHEEFLEIPQEVLITSMREHQRYFPVFNESGELLPHFVTVRNGNADFIENVKRGNEKVLRARLSDARFFYKEDLSLPIPEALQKLEKVVYHEELGTIAEKVARITDIAGELAGMLQVSTDEQAKVKRAAEICKFDLVTQMVGEFPELQGVMGEDYARQAGEEEEVARAVFEHYLPRQSGDELPKSRIGALVSIADKLDSIVGCFSIGIIPTGSQDPYALRRQASGIVQIIHDKALPLTLSEMFATAINVLKKQRALQRSEQEITDDLGQFFSLRIKNQISSLARYDVIDAIMAASFDDIGAVARKAAILAEETNEPGAKTFFDAMTRVGNLAEKADDAEVDSKLFEEAAEIKLYEAWSQGSDRYRQLLRNGEEQQALAQLKQLTPIINDYFDQVMVMVEREETRRNRLAFLAALSNDFAEFADFSKLVWDK